MPSNWVLWNVSPAPIPGNDGVAQSPVHHPPGSFEEPYPHSVPISNQAVSELAWTVGRISWSHFYMNRSPSGIRRGSLIVSYRRRTGNTTTEPAPYPYWVPGRPPIFYPMPQPLPIVNPAPNPALYPEGERGPVSVPRTRPQRAPELGPGVIIRPHSPGRRPPPPAKEKKFRMNYGGPGAAIGAIGEGLDLLDSLHDALPKHLQAKPSKGHRKPTPQQKALALWKNIGSMNIPQAVANAIGNAIEDRAWGKVGKALGAASGRLGKPIQLGELH